MKVFTNLDEMIREMNDKEDAAGDEWTPLERRCRSVVQLLEDTGTPPIFYADARQILRLIAKARTVK